MKAMTLLLVRAGVEEGSVRSEMERVVDLTEEERCWIWRW